MKNFLNYSKNRFLFFIIKLVISLFLAYLFFCFLTISPVHASSDIVCYNKDGVYDYYRLKYSILGSENTIKESYIDAYNKMKSSMGWSEYMVSLRIDDPITIDDSTIFSTFTFDFLNDVYVEDADLNYSAYEYVHYRSNFSITYSLNSDTNIYSESSRSNDYTYGTPYTLSYLYHSGKDYCSAYPLVFFTGNYLFKVNSYNGDGANLYYPVFESSDYTHESLSSGIPYVTDYYLPELANLAYKEISLDVADFVALWPKDYSQSFDSTMFFKGMVCPTSVYEYGTIANTNFYSRCSIDYTDYTKNTFSVLQSDLDNHAVYYFKGYKKGASIKINTNQWDYKFINYEDDPTLTIGDNTYNILNYSDSDLPNNATVNEDNNVAPGSSDNFFDSILDGIKAIFRSISSFFSDFFNKLINVISDLFVPPDGFMDDYIVSMKDAVTTQLGILIYPFTFLEYIINRIVNFHPTNGTIHIPEIKDPFYHVTLIEEQTINLYDIFTSGNLNSAYNIYLYVVDVYLIFGFLNLCYKKFHEFVCSNYVGGGA